MNKFIYMYLKFMSDECVKHETQCHTHYQASINNVSFIWKVCSRKLCLQFYLFREINDDESFYVPEHCHHNPLHWPLRQEHFLTGELGCFYSIGRLSTQIRNARLWIFFLLLKYAASYTWCLLQKLSYGLHLSTTKNLMTGLFSSLEHFLICCHFQ